ncbi:WS/DGAT domain-containing protein, partial [Actinoplanes sp. NPDC051633]|uniref:WS/DGAT domain-containing protein n=1 Tax=Actinoplanes sp. NPDC051633 TaxID=3155670 RepID=UPI0034296E61
VPFIALPHPYPGMGAVPGTPRRPTPAAPGDTSALLGPAFRILARLGAYRWFVDRQRLVTTMVTNLRGPEVRLSFLGVPITEVIPVSAITGNVTVAFAVLSYAGTLVITVVADPQLCPALPFLVARLQSELDLLIGAEPAATRTTQRPRG